MIDEDIVASARGSFKELGGKHMETPHRGDYAGLLLGVLHETLTVHHHIICRCNSKICLQLPVPEGGLTGDISSICCCKFYFDTPYHSGPHESQDQIGTYISMKVRKTPQQLHYCKGVVVTVVVRFIVGIYHGTIHLTLLSL
jgi:hypothetical protein